MRFKDLEIGEVFIFTSQLSPRMGLARGPWRKISPRKYSHLHDETLHNIQVGSINVNVSTEKGLVYR